MAGATKSIVFNAPVERVFAVITDYEKYPEFLSEVKSVRLSARSGGEVTVQWTVDVMKTIKYSVRMKEEKPSRVSWTFIEGEMMKDNKGSWILAPHGEGKTEATYVLEMAFGALVPKTIINALAEKQLPAMLQAFKKRVEGQP